MRAFAAVLLFLFAALLPTVAPVQAQSTGGDATSVAESYHLGAGDRIHVNVFGQPDLSGDFAVDGTGTVQLPLVGQVKAIGLTTRQFETEIADALKSGEYLKDPRVSVQVINYRPFYIIGEVNKPGEYPYVDGMTALNAVALAGGFTFRADEGDVYIRHNGGTTETKYPADQTTHVLPGDIVRVGERFF